MQMLRYFLPLLLITVTLIGNNSPIKYHQEQQVLVYSRNNSNFSIIEEAFKRFSVEHAVIDTLVPDDANLYILFDVFNIPVEQLPKYYITYQTLDLSQHALTEEYLQKLAASVAVWDNSWQNIGKYSNRIFNYYYFPQDYEYADPVILPCFLPTTVLDSYKELLVYSNQVNTEISSLVPVLFFHSYQQNPKVVIEAGVCLGYSTHAMAKIVELCNAKLFGLDNDPNAAPAYANINGTFMLINDVDFARYYAQTSCKDMPLDIVFIDTSHQYEHTLAEIRAFMPMLAKNGCMMFHDSNVTPLIINGRSGFARLNNTTQMAAVNPRGVTYGLKDYFSISFDESKYYNTTFVKDESTWHMIHYPFCNGLMVLKRL